MKRCPVCSEIMQEGLKCKCCGFDLSQDYEMYQTLGQIDPHTLPVTILRKKLEEEKIRQAVERATAMVQVKGGEDNAPGVETPKEAVKVEALVIESQEPTKEEKDSIEVESSPAAVNHVGKKKGRSKVLLGLMAAGVVLAAAVTMIVPRVTSIKKYQTVEASNIAVGDSVYMGSLDGNTIEWKVLAVEEGKALILSKDILVQKKYNEEYKGVTWDTCSLRTWLNSEFINDVFSDEEQGRILETRVTADKNPRYSTNPGADTTDKAFLLSISEVNRYFASDVERTAVDSKGRSNWWWLRSPGSYGYSAADVYSSGSVFNVGDTVSGEGGVRPAMWINLES